ncbi:MAG: nitroreductase [Burkholderiales bacterium]|nr:nitroreductase [Burkholderiales bacterium]
MIDVAQALLARKSVRAYLKKPVSRVDIETILNYARYSPSGTNTQPWDVAVVSGNSKQQLDALLLKQFCAGIPQNMDYHYYPVTQLPPLLQSRRRACGLQLFSALGITRDHKEKRMLQWAKNYSAFDAPVALYFFADAVLEKGSFMDYGMFLQSIMLMASAMGLATCPQAALAEQPQIVKAFLGRERDNVVLVCGMALGYEDTSDAVNSYRTVREEVASFTKFYD